LEIKEQMSSSGYGFGFVCTEKVKKVLDYSSLGISESDVIVMDATFVSNDNYIRPYLSDSLLPAGVRSDMDFSNADISVWKCTYEDLSSQTTTSEIWETEGLNRKIGIDTPSAFPNLDCERARASQSDYNNPNSDFYFEKIGEYSEISKPGDSDGESIILERIPWSFYKYIDGDGTLSYDNFNHDVRFVGRYLNYLSGAHSKMEISDTEMICNGTPIDVYSLYQCNAPVGYYNENQGYYDALVAIMQAKKVGQPSHKPIYFCVDTNVLADDAFRMEDDKSPRICEIISYFDGIYNCFINKTINNFEYEIGIYSCGFACQSVEKFLKSKPNSRYVYVMLAGAISFAGTAESRVDENTWNIMQDVILHDDYIYDEESDDIKKVEDLSCYGRYDLNTSSSKRGIGGWHRQNG